MPVLQNCKNVRYLWSKTSSNGKYLYINSHSDGFCRQISGSGQCTGLESRVKYITGIIQNYDHKLLEINGMPDHVHIFFGMRPTQGLSKLMQQVKEDSTKWINRRGFLRHKFNWQEGFGAFSYSRSHVPAVCTYIEKQEEHHRKKTFLTEYKELLTAFEIEFDEAYLFKPLI